MKIDIKIPAVGESVNSAVIGAWKKTNGSYVERDEILVLLETDKASMEVPSEHSGRLTILKKDGEEAQVGEVIGSLDASAKKPADPLESKAAAQPAPAQSTPSQKTSSQPPPPQPISAPVHSSVEKPLDLSKLSPAVRHTVLQKNINPQHIQGTGKDGRIKFSDLSKTSSAPPAPAKTAQEHRPSFSANAHEEVRREKMTAIRKRISERLVASQHNTATLTTFNEVNMTRIIQLRKEYKEVFQKKYGIKLGFMGFFIKAVIQAMKAHPRVGAQIEGSEMVFHKHCHISIAVSTEKGLIVPVIRYADQMSIAHIEQAVLHFAKKAREGQIRPDDLTGGIFTISNGGVFGSLLSTPILNPPQSGILGMHKIEQRPAAINGQVTIQPMMYLALSYDHRIVDGKESVGFLAAVKECIEEPSRILLDI